MDLAVVGVSIESDGADRGAKATMSAIDRIEKRTDGLITEFQRLAQHARQAFGAPRNGATLDFLRRYASLVREAGESLQNAGGAFERYVTQPLLRLGRTAIGAYGDIENVQRALRTLDGSRAEAAFLRLSKQADDLKTSFTDYVKQVVQVRATQKLTADESERLVQGLVNVRRAVGATTEAQERGISAINQILSKNQIAAEELRGQLLEAIPNLAPIIEKRFGSLQAEVLEKKFGAKKFVAGLIEEINKLDKLEPTRLEKFQISLERLGQKFAPLGTKVLDLLNNGLDPLLSRVGSLVDSFAKLSPEMQQNTITAGLFAAALGPVLNLVGATTQALGAFGNILVVVRGSIIGAGGLTAAISGLNPVLLGLAGLLTAGGIAWYEYKRRVDEAAYSIELAKRKAAGLPPELINAREVDIGGGRKANVLNDRDLSINLAGAVPDKYKGLVFGPDGVPRRATDKIVALPKPPGDKTAGAAALKQQEAALRQLAESRRELQQAVADQSLALTKDNLDRELRLLEESYQSRTVTIQEYFASKRLLEEAALRNEIENVAKLTALEKERLGAAKNDKPEAIRAQIELIRLQEQSTLLERQLGDVRRNNFNEFLAELAKQKAEQDKFAQEELRRERERKNAQLDAPFGKLELGTLRIQNDVALGLLAEEQGRRKILELERQLKPELEQNLRIRLALAAIANNPAAVLQIQKEIENLRLLGIERQKQLTEEEKFQQRVKELYDGFKSNLRSTLTDAFQAGFEAGPKAFFSRLVTGFRNALSQLASELLTSSLIKLLGSLLGGLGGGTGKFFSGIFSSFGGFRATGGLAFAGTPYVVGERGPELFVPRQSGRVIPNNEVSRNRNSSPESLRPISVSASVHVSGVQNARSFIESKDQIAGTLADAVERAIRVR